MNGRGSLGARSMTRRQALGGAAGGALALALAACGSGPRPSAGGSTLQSTWTDPTGGGILRAAGGVPLIDRGELAAPARGTAVLGTLAHVTDAHVLDAQSPARVTFLDRLGPPFASTFRPQEALTAQVLAGMVPAIAELAPDAVIQGGDLIDNAQTNELAWALAALTGGRVEPGNGGRGYFGVQWAGNPDPFYYRPDVDAPRYPGLLNAATHAFRTRGLGARWYPVLGDHDLLVQGVLRPNALTGAIALGDHAVWELPSGLSAPVGAVASATSPDGLVDPAPIDTLIEQLKAVPGVRVRRDDARRELTAPQALRRLRAAAGLPDGGPLLDYSFDVGEHVRILVLDLVRREGGSGGLVHAGQPQWLAEQLAGAAERWVLVFSHQPLTSSEGGGVLLALLDRHPRVLAAIWGHTHRHRIVPRPGPGGGYWLISTGSLIDYPQQARALQVLATAGGGAALRTWLLDHVPVGAGRPPLGAVARELAYLDAQGGRPQGFAGSRLDGNVTLYRPAPFSQLHD